MGANGKAKSGGGNKTRYMAADGRHHESRRNRPLVSLDAVYAIARDGQGLHFDALVDIDSTLHRAFRVGPNDTIVTGGGSFGMIRATGHRPQAASRDIDVRADLLDLIRVDKFGLRAECPIDFRARPLRADTGFAVRKPEETLLPVHDSTRGLLFERCVQIH